ncbi:DUF21 domain-containing protein [Glycine max]|nr:DUF21 domain-containing protein [Glycine max]
MHSYYFQVKNLLTIDPEEEIPVKNVTIQRIPRVPETLPLYDILNEFQKGHSHMAVVVRHCEKTGQQSSNNNADVRDVKVDIDGGERTGTEALREEQTAALDRIEAEYREQLAGLRRDAESKEQKLAEQWAAKHLRLTKFLEQVGCRSRLTEPNGR